MDSKDTLTWVVCGSVIAFFVIVGLFSSSTERQEKANREERGRAVSADAETAHQRTLEFIQEAEKLLPDYFAAIIHLKQRYTWATILQFHSLHDLHIALLKRCDSLSLVELPSLNSRTVEPIDLPALRNAHSAARRSGQQGPLEVFVQEPTVGMLIDLVSSELITTLPMASNECRRYTVKLTDSGYRLLSLNMEFGDKATDRLQLPDRPRGQIESRAAGTLLRRILTESAASDA